MVIDQIIIERESYFKGNQMRPEKYEDFINKVTKEINLYTRDGDTFLDVKYPTKDIAIIVVGRD